MLQKIIPLTFCILFFSSFVQAKIIKDDHYITGQKKFDWKQVCFKLTKRSSPLIEFKSIYELDCMGTTVNITPFCDETEAANPYYSRAIVSKTEKKVICQSAKRVVIKWECEGKKDRYCRDSEIGCFLFKERLAKRLKLVHQSITDKKYLNCYFDHQQNKMEHNI